MANGWIRSLRSIWETQSRFFRSSNAISPIYHSSMKNFSLALFAVLILAAAGCSRSNKPETSVKPQSTPDAERLKSDSERLQQATMNAAREREKANQATPTATASP